MPDHRDSQDHAPRRTTVLLSVVVVLVLLAAGPSSASPRPRAAAAAADDDEYVYEDGDDEYSSSGEHDEDDDAEDKDEALLRRGRHLDEADKLVVTFESPDKHAQASCPPTPPRRAPQCWAPRCASDAECASPPGQPRRRCCHNGCVRTCLWTADPPLVVDWEEETPDALHPDADGAVPAVPVPAVVASLAAPEVVALMGGCTLRAAELRRLQDFGPFGVSRASGATARPARGAYARRCFCSDGAILCRVR